MRRQRLVLLIGGCDCFPEGGSLSLAVIKLQRYRLSVLQPPKQQQSWRLFSLQIGKLHLAPRQIDGQQHMSACPGAAGAAAAMPVEEVPTLRRRLISFRRNSKLLFSQRS
jgi:hypothetical protein